MILSKLKPQSYNLLSKRLLLALMIIMMVISVSPHTVQAVTPDFEQIPTRNNDNGLNTGSAGIATADPDAPHSSYTWPFVWNQMGHLNSSYQGYGSLDSAYFHHGIDMVSNQPNVPVYTRSGGQVVNVENYNEPSALYWEVAILDPEGYVWQYHHVDQNSIPQAIHDAYAAWQDNPTTGGFVEADTHIGNVVDWPVETFGYFFHHIHLNILAAGDIYLNPLEFHKAGDKPDTLKPIIHKIGLFQGNTLLPGNTINADANYSLYMNASDLYQSDVFKLAPHTIAFKIDGANEWTTLWDFRKLPGGADEEAYVNKLYIPNHTKGNYADRDFYFDLGFMINGQRTFPKDAGMHTIDVRITDFAGNSAQSTYTWFVTETLKDNGCSSRQGLTKTFSFNSTRSINDIDLKLMLSHEERGQVWVSLLGPGDVVPTFIVNTTSDPRSHFNVTINDHATAPLHNGQDDRLGEPIFGRLAGPSRDGNLAKFFGRSAQGEWTVFICDNAVGKTGELMMLELDLHLPPNQKPLAEAQSFATGYTKPIAIILKGSDPDGDPITYHLQNQPSHGSLTGIAPHLTYTPKAGFFGLDSFSFVISDGDLESEPAVVSIQVLPGLFFPVVRIAD